MVYRLFISLLVLFAPQVALAQNGFHSYEEDGLFGVCYNGEVCLPPRFENIAWLLSPLYDAVYPVYTSGVEYKHILIPRDNQLAIFFFKENGKWGIANVWEIITPAFCDSLSTFSDSYGYRNHAAKDQFSFIKFKKDGKWGICNIEGETLISPIYDTDSISVSDVYTKFSDAYVWNKKKKSYKSKTLIYNNTYFDGKIDGQSVTLDVTGAKISKLKTWIFEEKRDKEDKKNGSILSEQILSIQQKRIDAFKAHSLIVERREGYPYKIFLGERNGMRVDIHGDTTTINGMPSIITSFGFVSMPIAYSSLEDRLSRNPFDIYAKCGFLEKKDRDFAPKYKSWSNNSDVQEHRVDFYTELADAYKYILSEIDVREDNNAYNYVFYCYAKADGYIKSALKSIERIEYKAQRREELINSLNSFANSMTTTAKILQGNN